MAHFTQIDPTTNTVLQTIVISNEQEHRGIDFIVNDLGLSGAWLKASYNARGGKHFIQIPKIKTYTKTLSSYDTNGNFISAGLVTETLTAQGLSASGLSGLRYNYPKPGDKYDPIADAFYTPTPYYTNWILDTTTYTWVPPIPYPTDNNKYVWVQSLTAWELLPNIQTNSLSSIN